MKAKGKARKGNGTDAASAKAAAVNAARAWAAALVAKLEGLADAVDAVNARAFGEGAAAELLAGVLDRGRLDDIRSGLQRLTEDVAGLIRGDHEAELPNVLAALDAVRPAAG